ncbi:hypothetical protein CTAYLR_002435 [Chrysophaeum taylorii]|uniref:PA domain-containing protein n=1 Tax=Chrysophaeum taylorii TaxID=2483200 RepID=A0AAD7ULZ2_9STRA|nr:hypothetical protein CTAYLR_002435 [Chrysophaeum taylorii]
MVWLLEAATSSAVFDCCDCRTLAAFSTASSGVLRAVEAYAGAETSRLEATPAAVELVFEDETTGLDDDEVIRCTRAPWARPLEASFPRPARIAIFAATVEGRVARRERRGGGPWGVVVPRGSTSFELKAIEATRAGAALVVIADNQENEILVRMARESQDDDDDDPRRATTVFVSTSDGERMRRAGYVGVQPRCFDESKALPLLRRLATLRQKRTMLDCAPLSRTFGWRDESRWALPPGLWRGVNAPRGQALVVALLEDHHHHEKWSVPRLEQTRAPSFASRVERLDARDARARSEADDASIRDALRRLEFLDKVSSSSRGAVSSASVLGASLDLAGAKLGPVDVAAVAGLRRRRPFARLDSLDLSANEGLFGSPRAVAALRPLLASPTLATLELWGTDAGDAALDLRTNAIGDAGACALTPLLAHLTSLDLADNDIGDLGAAALARRVETGSTLERLDASRNPRISADGIAFLLRASHANAATRQLTVISRELRLLDDENDDDDAGRRLDLSRGGLAAVFAAGEICQQQLLSRRITQLDLSRNALDDAGALRVAEAIQFNAALRVLDLSDNVYAAGAIEDIAGLFSRDPTAFASLERLIVTVDDADAKARDAALALGEGIRARPALRELGLSSPEDGVNNARRILKLDRLRANSADVSNRALVDFAAAVVSRFGPTRLDFSDNRLREVWGLDALLSARASLDLLGSLRFDLARRAAYLLLTDDTRVRARSLVGAPLDNSPWALRRISRNLGDADCVLVAAELSRTDASLTDLALGDNAVSARGVAELARGLRAQVSEHRLETLDLRGNASAGRAAPALADVLAINSALLSINLRQSGLDDEGAAELTAVLRSSSLTSLDVSANPALSEVGRKALRTAFPPHVKNLYHHQEKQLTKIRF